MKKPVVLVYHFFAVALLSIWTSYCLNPVGGCHSASTSHMAAKPRRSGGSATGASAGGAHAPKATGKTAATDAELGATNGDQTEGNRNAGGPTSSTTAQNDGRPGPAGGGASVGEDVVDASGYLSPPADVAPGTLGDVPDWSLYGAGFMNPFFDPGTICALPFGNQPHDHAHSC